VADEVCAPQRPFSKKRELVVAASQAPQAIPAPLIPPPMTTSRTRDRIVFAACKEGNPQFWPRFVVAGRRWRSSSSFPSKRRTRNRGAISRSWLTGRRRTCCLSGRSAQRIGAVFPRASDSDHHRRFRGAINAIFLAAHEGPLRETAELLADVWLSLECRHVFPPTTPPCCRSARR